MMHAYMLWIEIDYSLCVFMCIKIHGKGLCYQGERGVLGG